MPIHHRLIDHAPKTKSVWCMILFLVLGILGNQGLKAQSAIKGQIRLDTIWAPKAYLSIIPNFNELFTMSNDMIIERTDVDSFGYFVFNTSYLPSEDHFYRIHFSKKGDPPASLIIGGKEENHFFIIANNSTAIYIKNSTSETFLADISIAGYYPNQMLQQVNEIANYIDTIDFYGSAIKTEFIRKGIYEKLRSYADTCSHPLVSLYALHKSNFESNYPVNQQFYKNYILKWKREQSSYFKVFRNELPRSENKNLLFFIIIGVSFFTVGVIFSQLIIRSRLKNKNLLKELSVQERKIFIQIREGKSNQEISEAFNIELSTVKSHVNSIYSKLNINSRKELLNLDS